MTTENLQDYYSDVAKHTLGICKSCIDTVIEVHPEIENYDIALLMLKWHIWFDSGDVVERGDA
jgi:hypothetical protein